MATLWFVPPVFVKSETGGIRHGCNNARAALEQLKTWTRRGPPLAEGLEPLPVSLGG